MLVKIVSIMLEDTFTTDDVVERIALLRRYYGIKLFAGGGDVTIAEVIRTDGEEEHTVRVLEHWEQKFAQAGIPELVVYEALDAIEEDLSGMPSVTLYVPIHFAHEHIERFCRWFRQSVQPNILLSLRVDPRVGGGCGVIWNDVYHDLSLKYRIHQKRTEVVEMFNRYTHA
jgi:hypothetical protein